MSPATAAHAGKTTTAIGNADTKDGRFTENTDERTTFDQNKKRAVIRWDVMDQKADNTLTFVQGKKQSVLNQASGVSMSVFRGMVKCSGSCVFANEAGVLFADGSYLDVGKTLATIGGNVDEGAFRNGRIHAGDLFGEVENQGVIHAGAAAFIGSRITNGGEIVVDDGTLTMVVGEEVWMRNHGSNVVIRSALPPAGSPESSDTDFDDIPAIENTGTLRAGDGRVRMLAGDMLSFAIRNQGEIQARKIRLEAGDDGLVEVGGGSLLDASNQAVGARGGKIKVLGGYVAIVDDAVLDASGDSGGGKILVGGNRGGRGKTRTAKGTFVGAGTTLRADATRKGDGGKVIVWSDGTTRAYGEISAQGGIDGGDGGFVETSGLEYLDVLSSPLISARSGRAEDRGGKWLIDPYDIDIVDGCGATSECLDERLEEASTYDPEIVFEAKIRPGDASDTPSEIDGRLIEQVLLGGADVTITTNGRGKKLGGDPGDIRLLTDLFFDGDGTDDAVAGTESTLKLHAANDIILDGDATSALGAIVNLDSNLTLNLDFRANNGQSELETENGDFAGEYLGNLELNDHIITGGGAVSLSGVNVTLDANIETAGGSVTVLAEGGDATLNADIDTTHSDPDESGGGVLVAALGRVVEDPDDKKRDVVRGGDIHVSSDTNIDTDGGSVTVSAGNRQLASLSDVFGGNLFFDGDIDSGTGRVSLEAFRARKKTDNGTSQFGGELVYDENASIETDGAAVDISVSIDSRSGTRSDNNTRVRIFGDIDTNATADSDAGGGVEILSDGLVGKIEIGDAQSSETPVITTGGGDVRISSSGKLSFVRGSIDARFDGVQDPEEDDIEGDVSITAIGLMSVRSEGAEDIEIQGDALVQLAGALDGASNLRIETPTSGVKLSAEKIELRAGDGLGNFDTAQVDLSSATNALQFSNSDETGNPLELTIAQDADLTTANNLPAADQFQTGTLELESLTLQSFDGHLDLDGFAAETSDTMTLGAREGIIADSATLTATGKLEIEVYEDFTVSAGLASTLSANPPSELKITTGTLGGFRNGSDAGLEVEGNLTATDSLELHAGAGGSGDLTFTSNPTLTSNEITLWAGDGSASNSGPEVVVVDVMDPDDLGDDVGLVDFDLGGTTNRSFTLRQSAAIERDTIPLASQFADGIDDLDYTLRSDGGSIGGEDEINTAKLLDTNLSVHALAGVDATYTDGAADAALRVRSLDIGGTQDFTYTREHNDTYELDDGGGETILVIRAGISGSGDLRFDGEPEDQNDDSDFVIEADEIRLVAGDGLGGQITSRVILAATAANAPIFRDHTDDGDGNDAVRRFVFRQDAPIQATDVARVDEVFDGIAPLLHVIHSDYDSSVDSGSPQSAIQFLSPDIIASAQDKLIVSGESVDVFADESYDLTEYFDEDEVGDAMSLEIRTDTLTLAADDNDDQENS
ncbi:MAG: hypothetical protein GY728_14455, partial [Phycisphaeraceae bacterium]|nr:hypothetical protein [Phycisphaeraceae bacterium]